MPELRRNKMLSVLQDSKYVTGSELARIFNVTRQVIVKDVAVLRAAGHDIIATPKGYFLQQASESTGLRRVIAIKHDASDIHRELEIIVDCGGKVLDVIVEHPVYGEIKANLMIDSRLDLELFIEKTKKYNARPLSSLTAGVHLHTIEAKSEEVWHKISEKLSAEGFLLND